MRRSKIRAYLHIVWGTYQRMPLVTPEIEESVYRCIQQEAVRFKAEVLAIGGMPDHVHLVVAFPTTCSFSEFVQQVKGVSSKFVKDQLLPPESFFRWQEGYGLFTLSPNHLKNAVPYVENQKQHHSESNLWPQWEDTDEEAPKTNR
jgi:putative transposase